jgi:hypothetical protein
MILNLLKLLTIFAPYVHEQFKASFQLVFPFHPTTISCDGVLPTCFEVMFSSHLIYQH